MRTFSNFPKIFTGLVLLCAVPAFGQQTNPERITGTWSFEKFEFEKPYPDSAQVKSELKGVIFCFDKSVLTISKIEKGREGFIKSGPYSLQGEKLIIGEDLAEILLLDNNQLRIKTFQGILYFSKT
jgi:hypothetical protein